MLPPSAGNKGIRKTASPNICYDYRTQQMSMMNLSELIKSKGSPYSTTERRVPELIPVLGSQPAGDVSHKPGGWLSLLSPGLQLPPQPLRGLLLILLLGVNSLPKTVTRQRRDCDLNPGPSAPESSMLTTRLPSHPKSIAGKQTFTLLRSISLSGFVRLPRKHRGKGKRGLVGPIFTPLV